MAFDLNIIFILFKNRARPVAVVEATTSFDIENKLVSLDDKKCTTVRDRKQVTCTVVNSCLKYNGINLPTQIGKCQIILVFSVFFSPKNSN